jgi:hypothetical protein
VHYHAATASSFVTNIWGEVFTHFHAGSVKCHSDMQNWTFGVPGQILSDHSPKYQKMRMLMTLLVTCLTFFGLGAFGFFHWEDCCFLSSHDHKSSSHRH